MVTGRGGEGRHWDKNSRIAEASPCGVCGGRSGS